MLEARDLTWGKANRKILANINLKITEGSRVGLVGPNGSGKSSLLKLLALLERPTAGEVIYRGEKIQHRIPLSVRRKIAVIFQEPLLLNTNVFNNVAAGLQMRRLPEKEIQMRVQEWLRLFGIAHLERQQARTLSGGEAQRVSLARSFVLEPELLFMDEPFSALDALTKESLMNDLSQILSMGKTTVLIVSHDFQEIFRLCERAIILLNGQIAADAPPNELLQLNQTNEVEAFLNYWHQKMPETKSMRGGGFIGQQQ